jgi:hypothetical protein
MAFFMELGPLDEHCDICKQTDTTRPMLQLKTTGRDYTQRNFIWVHLDEFEAKLKRLKARIAAHDKAGEKVVKVGTLEGVSK